MSGFQPAPQLHARHVHEVHVEHDAAELRRRSVAEKGFSRGVSLRPQTTGVQQPLYARPHARIVFHDSNRAWSGSQRTAFPVLVGRGMRS